MSDIIKCAFFCFIFRPPGYTSGGGTLTLNGANFGPAGTQTVNVGSNTCSGVSGSQTQVTCTLPVGQGSAAVTLSTPSGSNSQTSGSQTFLYSAPMVTGVSGSGAAPTSGLSGGSWTGIS